MLHCYCIARRIRLFPSPRTSVSRPHKGHPSYRETIIAFSHPRSCSIVQWPSHIPAFPSHQFHLESVFERQGVCLHLVSMETNIHQLDPWTLGSTDARLDSVQSPRAHNVPAVNISSLHAVNNRHSAKTFLSLLMVWSGPLSINKETHGFLASSTTAFRSETCFAIDDELNLLSRFTIRVDPARKQWTMLKNISVENHTLLSLMNNYFNITIYFILLHFLNTLSLLFCNK